jgi:hypothetical protein
LADFGDTVHLHSGGGAKLLNLLAEKMAADKVVIAALKDGRMPEHQSTTVAGLKGSAL